MSPVYIRVWRFWASCCEYVSRAKPERLNNTAQLSVHAHQRSGGFPATALYNDVGWKEQHISRHKEIHYFNMNRITKPRTIPPCILSMPSQLGGKTTLTPTWEEAAPAPFTKLPRITMKLRSGKSSLAILLLPSSPQHCLRQPSPSLTGKSPEKKA